MSGCQGPCEQGKKPCPTPWVCEIELDESPSGHTPWTEINSFHGRFVMYADDLERFAALVAEREREECAKLCDETEQPNLYGVRECAAAIRARGETK